MIRLSGNLVFLATAIVSTGLTGCVEGGDDDGDDTGVVEQQLGCGYPQPPCPAPSWTMFGHDAQHTGRTEVVGPASLSPATPWYFGTSLSSNFPYTRSSSPIIASDGTVFFGSTDGYMRAVKPATAQGWSFAAGSPIRATAALGTDGTVYVLTDTGLLALTSTMTLKWKLPVAGYDQSSGATIGKDGTIYVGSSAGRLYAVTPQGAIKWTYPAANLSPTFPIYTSPALSPDGTRVYAIANTGLVHAVSTVDGALAWSYQAIAYSNFVHSSPAVAPDGTIYFGSTDHRVYALYPNGGLKWTVMTDAAVLGSPAIDATGWVIIGSGDWDLYAIAPNAVWMRYEGNSDGAIGTSVAIGKATASGQNIYFGTENGTVYAVKWGPVGFNAHAFTFLWKRSFGLGSAVDSSPALGADGGVYVGVSNYAKPGPGLFRLN